MELEEFFGQHKRVAVAFSGGVDSAYLLYAAQKLGAQLRAYYVKTSFQPQFELDDAQRFAGEYGIDLVILRENILEDAVVAGNPVNRCYYCKKRLFARILDEAKKDGYTEVLDGTNASDEVTDRPGMRALVEMQVLSPLRMCNLTKERIRELSREAGLFTWNKPSYACLATRIPTGEAITEEALQRTEWAEEYLGSLGFRDYRVRTREGGALLQFTKEDHSRYEEKKEMISETLLTQYPFVKLDPVYREVMD